MKLSPRTVSAILERYGDDVEIVFLLDGTGQFDAMFSAYYRLPADDDVSLHVATFVS